MSYMSRNPQVASVVLDDIAATTPGNPPAGKHKIVDRLGNIFVRNSSGAETIISSAAGNGFGEKNYITNPSGAASVAGWEIVGDLDVVRTVTAGELPREFSTKTGLKITADANAQTAADYVYFDFTLDDVDAAGRIMKLRWDQKVTGTYLSGELEVYIATQAARGTVAVTPFITAIPAQDGTFETYFLAPATATASLVIRCTGEMATDGGIVISDVVVGPNVQVQGSAIGAWKSFTPTGSWSANTTYTGFYREVGEDVEINVNIALAGAPTSAALTVNMPTGFTINSSHMAATTSSAVLGLVSIYDAAPATYEGRILYSSTSAVAVVVEKSDGTYGAYVAVTEAVPQTFANGDKVQLSYKVPVNELFRNVTLANRAVELYGYTTDTWDGVGSTTTFGPAGQTMAGALTTSRAKTITWPDNVQSTDSIDLELASTAYPNNWSKASSVAPLAMDSTGDATKSAGFTIASGAANTTVVTFNRYKTIGNDDAPAVDWANTMIWRLRRVSGGASVGYPVGSQNIVGRTDGVAPAVGMVGEKITATLAGASGGTVSTYYDDSGTLSLTPGSWDIYLNATVMGDIPGSVSGQTLPIGMLALRKSTTTLIEGYVCSGAVSNVNFVGVGAFIWPVNIAANTTYKASVKWIPNSGSPTLVAVTLVQSKSSFFAVRRA